MQPRTGESSAEFTDVVYDGYGSDEDEGEDVEDSDDEDDDDDDISPIEAQELEAWFSRELHDSGVDSGSGVEIEDSVVEEVMKDFMEFSSGAVSFEELVSRDSGRLHEGEMSGDNFPPIDDVIADINHFGYCWSDACAISCERMLVLGARWAFLHQRGLVPCPLESSLGYSWLSWPLPGHEYLLLDGHHTPIFYLFYHGQFCKAFLVGSDGEVEDVSVLNKDSFSALKVGGETFQLFTFLKDWVNLELLQACSSEGFFRKYTSVEEHLLQPDRPWHLSDEFQKALAAAKARSSARRVARLTEDSPGGAEAVTALVKFRQGGSSGSGDGDGRRRRRLYDEKGKEFKSGAKKRRLE